MVDAFNLFRRQPIGWISLCAGWIAITLRAHPHSVHRRGDRELPAAGVLRELRDSGVQADERRDASLPAISSPGFKRTCARS